MFECSLNCSTIITFVWDDNHQTTKINLDRIKANGSKQRRGEGGSNDNMDSEWTICVWLPVTLNKENENASDLSKRINAAHSYTTELVMLTKRTYTHLLFNFFTLISVFAAFTLLLSACVYHEFMWARTIQTNLNRFI